MKWFRWVMFVIVLIVFVDAVAQAIGVIPFNPPAPWVIAVLWAGLCIEFFGHAMGADK